MKYIRTCQSCGHKQEAKPPKTYVDKAGNEPWREVKCKKCRSADLDYGREVGPNQTED